MKKLTLDLDALQVESFATQDADARRGTVRAHDDTVETENCTIDQYTCFLRTCLTIKTCRTCAMDGDNDALPAE